jgi:serine/threonine protein phosphatase 1
LIIIGDIHGNYNTLMKLLGQIPQLEKDKGIMLTGDLIDRGPNSKSVIEWCIENNIPSVRGNHEQMAIDFIKNSAVDSEDFRSTLENYKSDLELLNKHIKWMNKLPIYLEFPDIKNTQGRYLVVSHSLITNLWSHRNEANPKLKERIDNLIMFDRPYNIKDVSSIYNVIGHTPQDWGARIRKNYACIDTGCWFNSPENNRLTALQFPEMIIYEQENVDREGVVNPYFNILTSESLHQRKKNKYSK